MNTRALILVFVLLSACSLPRGSALQSEILANAQSENAEFSVHPVTREHLAVYENWPQDQVTSYDWPSHRHQSAQATIAPYDVLSVQIWDNSAVSLLTAPATKTTRLDNVSVAANGKIFIPYVGHVEVANKTIEQARSHIQSETARRRQRWWRLEGTDQSGGRSGQVDHMSRSTMSYHQQERPT